jgi:polysaccharide chain length determinant protein (PEP-CTERM system associated)
MSVEFRQRTPGEYAQIIWKRKWLILLPTIAIASAIGLVVWKLPDVYQSTTLLIVRPPSISSNLVPTLSDDALSARIQSIGQIVMSRSKLEPLIVKYELYQQERQRGESMENLVDRMRTKDITVDLDRSRNDNIPAFKISFKERNPKVTQAVTAELARMYIDAGTVEVTNNVQSARQLFQQQLEEAKNQLDAIDQQRIKFMSEHANGLPTSVASLIGQLTSLREEQKSRITEIGRLRDQSIALSSQIGDLSRQTLREKNNYIDDITDPKTTPAYGQLLQRKADLDAELQDMKMTLKEKNPDVKRQQAKIDSVQREMDKMVAEHQAKVDQIKERIKDQPDLRVNNLKLNLQATQSELVRQQQAFDQNSQQINQIEANLNTAPGTQVGLEALDRQYQTAKQRYDDVLKSSDKIETAARVETNSQGETIQVIDPANYPQKPISPKRPILIGIGIALGLAVGLTFAALFEVPRLLTIQSTKDAAHYTGLPVLASVPELLTPQEARRIPQKRLLLLAAGIVLTILSIPALALALRATHIFDRFVS